MTSQTEVFSSALLEQNHHHLQASFPTDSLNSDVSSHYLYRHHCLTAIALGVAEMALSMTESEAADKTSQLNRLEQALLSRLRSVEAREAAVAPKEGGAI